MDVEEYGMWELFGKWADWYTDLVVILGHPVLQEQLVVVLGVQLDHSLDVPVVPMQKQLAERSRIYLQRRQHGHPCIVITCLV